MKSREKQVNPKHFIKNIRQDGQLETQRTFSTGVSQPRLVSYLSKHNPQTTKHWVEKHRSRTQVSIEALRSLEEASFSEIRVQDTKRRIIGDLLSPYIKTIDGKTLPNEQIEKLCQLHFGSNSSVSTKALAHTHMGNSDCDDYTAYISPPSSPGLLELNEQSLELLENIKTHIYAKNWEELEDRMKPFIKCEKIYGCIAGAFAQILMGSDTPKTRLYVHPHGSLSILSQWKKEIDDIPCAYEKAESEEECKRLLVNRGFIQHAVVRRILRFPDGEIKMDNILYDNGNVLMIDPDWGFSGDCPLNLDFPLTAEGIVLLYVETKPIGSFEQVLQNLAFANYLKGLYADQDEQVKNWALEVYENLVRMDDKVIEYIIDQYMLLPDGKPGLNKEERDQVKGYMREVKEAAVNILKKNGREIEHFQEPMPWIKALAKRANEANLSV